jgi:GTPase SAR1 family protein
MLVFLVIILNIVEGKICSYIQWSAVWIGAGFLLSIFLNSGGFHERNILKEILNGKKEFKKVSENLTFLSIFVILIMFTIYYLEVFLFNKKAAFNGDLLYDLAVITIFLYFFSSFMKYEPKNSNILVLGPKGSGKSLFLAGAYLNALEAEGSNKISPSEALIELIDELQKKHWPRRTEDVKEYSFIYRSGKLFPKDTRFYTKDYPGPYLEKIYEFMQTHEIPIKEEDYEDDNELNVLYEKDTLLSKEAFFALEKKIKESDKLIFLVDGEKYPNFTNMGIKNYLKMLKFLNDNKLHKDFYLVLTKCDLFLEKYQEKTTQSVITNESYDDFKTFMNDLFLENLSVKPLLRDSNCDFFYPVFYHTILENGTYVPLKDSSNSVLPPFGYGPLMNDLIK